MRGVVFRVDAVLGVIVKKSRVRESRMLGSVRAKAEWLSYSTATDLKVMAISDKPFSLRAVPVVQ